MLSSQPLCRASVHEERTRSSSSSSDRFANVRTREGGTRGTAPHRNCSATGYFKYHHVDGRSSSNDHVEPTGSKLNRRMMERKSRGTPSITTLNDPVSSTSIVWSAPFAW